MKAILKDIYLGEYCPAERAVPKDPRYRELIQLISEERETISRLVGEDVREKLILLEELMLEMQAFEQYEQFRSGFTFARMLFCELFERGGDEG